MLINGVMAAEAGSASASTINSAVTSALSLGGTAISYCLENPVLAICVGAALAAIGFKVFRKARKSVGF